MEESILRGSINRILHLMARFSPGASTIRPFLHKLRGVKIRGKVFIGDDVYLENAHPECIEIHDEAQIALRTTIIAHFRGTGKVIIRKKVWIGLGCKIAAGPGQTLTIGEGAVLGAGSVVIKNVPQYTFVAGVPAKPIAKVTVPMTIETSFEDFKNGLIPIKEI